MPLFNPTTGYRCRFCHAWDEDYHRNCPACERPTAMRPVQPRGAAGAVAARPAVRFTTMADADTTPRPRVATGQEGLDWVLEGGLVEGAGLLIGGEPGAGKSTLLQQVCATWPRGTVLYASAEEPIQQVASNAARVGVPRDFRVCLIGTDSPPGGGDVTMEYVEAAVRQVDPTLIVLDSIQKLRSEALDGPAGSMQQQQFVCDQFCKRMKAQGRTLIVVCQVTKDGELAGPKALEHVGDAVLFMEGPRTSRWKRLRVFKHRFGAVDRAATHRMDSDGLRYAPGEGASADEQEDARRERDDHPRMPAR